VLDSLAVIGQALGLVMDRFSVNSDQAFDYLDESAARANLGLGTYAQQLVDRGGIA
jgi:AmiR/NasT family two-component response regulator